MSLQSLIDQMKINYESLLNYLEDEDNEIDDSQRINIIFEKSNLKHDKKELGLLLKILSSIINNHSRKFNLFNKIKLIIKNFKNEIQQFYSNIELFQIFESNKLILLFLVKEKIIIFNEEIFELIATNVKYIKRKYPHYFQPEIKPFMTKEWISKQKYYYIKDMIEDLTEELPEDFEENREKGENESYICQLIRDDLVKEFIVYVNQNNYPLNSRIERTIYETNYYINKEYFRSLLNYALFFGSIQIIQYLISNGIKLDLWSLKISVYSNNPELIHLIERYDTKMTKYQYEIVYKKSIKCHHNEIANYIKNTYLYDCEDSKYLFCALKNYNIRFIQPEFIQNEYFYDLCLFDYYHIVDVLVKNENFDINNIRTYKGILKLQ